VSLVTAPEFLNPCANFFRFVSSTQLDKLVGFAIQSLD
jgi:hypothetical protein